MNWTDEQKLCIEKRGNNILVAAGAGSGKTAVLVERIISKVINEKVDVDKLLVVTFTHAAASEMKERLLNRLYELQEQENSIFLNRQINLLNKASICTIDSFCLDIVKNNFYKLDISPNFKILDTAEDLVLCNDIIDDIFDEKYEEENEEFEELLKSYTTYKNDGTLKQLIIDICKKIESNPYPLEFLKDKIELYNYDTENFSDVIWGQVIIEKLKDEIKNSIAMLKSASMSTLADDKGIEILFSDIEQLENLEKTLDNWDRAVELFSDFKFRTWRCKSDESIKQIRDVATLPFRKGFVKDVLNKNSSEIKEENQKIYRDLKYLYNLILEFNKRYERQKKKIAKFTFSDIEHFAVKILVEKVEDGKIIPTQIAQSYTEKFDEIFIDEYQDSNLVQEYILNAISKNNIFMVGDVKQSIYKFRQAMPKLFLEKYKNYTTYGEAKKGSKKIQLFKNFRSTNQVLDFTNYIFQNIMSEQIGDIDYVEEEYLNYGASYIDTKSSRKAQINVINYIDEEEKVYETEDVDEEKKEELEQLSEIEKTETEAIFIANKIEELIKSKYQVQDKDTFRDVQYKDIVILMRSPNSVAKYLQEILERKQIPYYSDISKTYLDSYEINLVLNLLKVIDNPMQDIPFCATLRSYIFGFTDDEIVRVRMLSKKTLYEAFLEVEQTDNPLIVDKIKTKTKKMFNLLEKLYQLEQELSLDEFLWELYNEISIINYVSLMKNSYQAVANLKLLLGKAKIFAGSSFKGIYQFIKFIEKLKEKDQDLDGAKVLDESSNVVRIMSIHKSKGLEFPIVFLTYCGRQFNEQDKKNEILLHNDLGLAPKFSDYENLLKYNSTARYATQFLMDKENLSEEIRVLYVALTRAKEKLIITGLYDKTKEQLENLETLKNAYKRKDGKINYLAIQKNKSYLNWMILSTMYEDTKDICEINYYTKKEILSKEYNLQDSLADETQILEDINYKEEIVKYLEENKENVSKKELEKLDEDLNYIYPYEISTKIQSKTSVSKIKMKNANKDRNIKQEDEQVKDISLTFKKPSFIEEKKDIITPARKGSIYHLIFERLENIDYTKKEIDILIDKLIEENLIFENERKVISFYVIDKYLKSKLFEELKSAKEVYHERPFFMYIDANEVLDELKDEKYADEKILVQGIIDLYYIDKKDNLILVDYKTDFVDLNDDTKTIEQKQEDIREKYIVQLELYKRALEIATNKKVYSTIIYSTYLGEIKIF